MDAPREHLGQHLLRDDEVIERVVSAARLRAGERVLDAGAGHGALTRPIAAAVGPRGVVYAIEIDQSMMEGLRRFQPPQVQVIEDDLLTVDLPGPLDAVVANPPFRVAAPFIERIVAARVPRAVLVLPFELADRLVARPGAERYGKLTVRVRALAHAEVLGAVSRRAFNPPPGVACAIVGLRARGDADDVDVGVVSQVVDVAWPSWQRLAKHALAPLPAQFRADSAAFQAMLKEAGWADEVTAKLPPAAFAEVARHLATKGRGPK